MISNGSDPAELAYLNLENLGIFSPEPVEAVEIKVIEDIALFEAPNPTTIFSSAEPYINESLQLEEKQADP